MLRSTVNIACVVYIFKTFYHGFPKKAEKFVIVTTSDQVLVLRCQARAVTEVGESSNEEPQIDYEGQWFKSHFIFSHGALKAVLEINTKKCTDNQVCHLPRPVNHIITTLLDFSWISCHRLFTLISIHEPLPLPLCTYPHFYPSIFLFISLSSSAIISKQTPLIILYLPL
jgi:hypothetical protein